MGTEQGAVTQMTSRIIIILISSLISACASVPSVQLSPAEIERQFAVSEGKALIFLCRKIEVKGSGLIIPVSLNNQFKGNMGYKTYFRWEVEPGKHTIQAHMAKGAEIDLMATEGESYFVYSETTFAFMGQPGAELTLISRSEGMDAVRSSKFIAEKP
ncbi:DUF2846 domain-containing protein [bacterium SCSIO 12696]|nr:DUF2846 domain-containing protein [bacterium SCSIO 12696]